MEDNFNSVQTVQELEEKLGQFQGLKEVRISIHALIRLLQVWKQEEEQHISYTPVPLHLIFAGEPGTGRTQAAELMGQIYHALGYLSGGGLVKAEVSALNQETAAELIQQAEGNILLLSRPDELTPDGAELLEKIMNRPQENIVIILKGSRQAVETMFERLPAMRTRFSQYFIFADFQREDFQVKPVPQEQEKQPEIIQETELSVPERPVLKNLDSNARTGALLKPGARLDLSAYLEDEIRIRLVWKKLRLPMEMDAYVFLLHENEMTACDEDMVFFGNLISRSGGAAIVNGTAYPEAVFRLPKVFQDIQKIAVCFSAYGDNPAFDFSQVEKPVLQIFRREEQIAWMDLQNLQSERTLVAAELYRYQSTWKFRAVSAGYRDGLEHLCQRFGIEVE